jgi:hypothetical protein
MIVFTGVSNQAVRPETVTLTMVDTAQRTAPPSRTSRPRTKNGPELAIRWSQPPCSNGAL